jgi:1-aminocyclopropane-1-carboxylate deaminase/D-cysteine desulfhydrase-like pyridoxal-dependent ACC family enzyme
MLFDISKALIQELHDELFLQKQVRVSVLRLDKIDPLVSGNKIFKLHYFLEEALRSDHKTILSFGGAYSNHLAATARACRMLHLKSIAIVRGEKPEQLSLTLQQCISDGMQLKFISRQQYAEKEGAAFMDDLKTEFGICTIVPEGRYHPLGAKGAALIMDLINERAYTHICTASGTATTLAGLITAAEPTQTIINVPVLKGINDTLQRIQYLTGILALPENLKTLPGYHFGGYAKKNNGLIEFMNHCRLQYDLPLDFIYTAKMFYAVLDCIKNNYFKKGSDIICLHTGGLQGNKSLPLNSVIF